MRGRSKVNIFPLLGDLSLLVIAFFIIIVFLQQLTILKSENPILIPTDTYFNSGKYELNAEKEKELKNYLYNIKIKDQDIFSIFKDGNIKMIRIEGHTDNHSPTDSNRVWKTNRELSLFRANTICTLFEEMAKESIDDENKVQEFKSKLFPGGYGEFIRYARIFHPDSAGRHEVVTSDGKSIGHFDEMEKAIKERDALNRRIEISIINKKK